MAEKVDVERLWESIHADMAPVSASDVLALIEQLKAERDALAALLVRIESTGALTEGFESSSMHREICNEYQRLQRRIAEGE